MADMSSDCIMFDDDQRVRILHLTHRKNAEEIVSTTTEYHKILNEFETASSFVLEQLEGVASEAEAKRKLALSASIDIAARDVTAGHVASVNTLKTSLQMAKLEQMKLTTQAIASMQDTFKQTRTAMIEIFGGQ